LTRKSGSAHAKRAVVLDGPFGVNSSLRDDKGLLFLKRNRAAALTGGTGRRLKPTLHGGKLTLLGD